MRVTAGGGTTQVLTTPSKEEVSHRWPEILPGGKAVLFTAWGMGMEISSTLVQSLETGERRVIVQDGAFARYTPTGHLVYAGTGGLLAVPFDLRRLEVTGPAVSILGSVSKNPFSDPAQFSFSRDGSLVYLAGVAAESQLVWVDRRGAAQPLTEARRAYWQPRLSPDGRWVAASVRGLNTDI